MISAVEVEQALVAAGLGEVTLSAEQLERVCTYFEHRSRWAKVHNLSGPKALAKLQTDLVDAIVVWRLMDPMLKLVDVGTGSGVPGLLVSCLDPERSIDLVEPIAKRCAFLKTASSLIGLKNVQVYRSRWPMNLTSSGHLQLISRAVVSPEEWPKLAVSGGKPHTILQMLAAKRPRWTLPDYQHMETLTYFDPEGGEREVRRWSQISMIQM